VLNSLSATEVPFAGRLNTASKFTFWPFVIFTLVLFGLEVGVWETTETHWGPFVQDPFVPASLSGRSVGFAIHGTHAFKCCVGLRSDNNEHPFQSDLRLWINEREIGPPHTQHELISKGETAGFSNWAEYVIFALPPGVQNDSTAKATVRYALRPVWGSTAAFALATSLLGLIAYRRGALGAPHILLLTLGYAGLALSILYVAWTLVALAAGWALPTTALIRWFSIAQWMCRNEPFLPYVLLACVGLGVVAAWLRPLFNLAPAEQEKEEAAFRCFFQRWGLLITACALTFSISGMWAGLVRSSDLDGFAIAGMIQFTDAAGHLTAAHDQAKDGVWNAFALRRPIAAAFRSTLLFFAGFSLSAMLLLQACLLAGAICFASAAVTRWRGLWAGVTFFALTYICVRTFAPTTLSEPLGLLAALASVPFFIEAFRTGSVPAALLAFAFTTIALMTRMGSMFTIPAVMLWLVWQFGTTLRERIRVALIAGAIISGIGTTNYLLETGYGNHQQYLTGSNFSYTLCGLTMGTTWDRCRAELAERIAQRPHTEGMPTEAAYSLAWENFTNHPSVFFNRLLAGAHAFLTYVPDLLFRGYGAVIEPSWFPRTLILALILIGLLYVLSRRENRKQVGFWILLWASIVTSAAFVFFDQGQRVLASSYPLIFLFFAMGMTGPNIAIRREDTVAPKLVRFGATLLIASLFLFFSIPWLAHRLSPAQSLMAGSIAGKSDQAVVFGGRRLAGFLVLPDEMPLRKETASLHLSEFEAIIKQSDIEKYQGLIHPEMPPLPFGFIFAPRLEKDAASVYQFIVPPDVMERRDVKAWRMHVKRWQPETGGNWWLYVTRAEPLH
jgi:hypothetical protein